ncbi:D-alanyl-D-alanine carboxypeptidase family protein [Ornithinibacillus massiliensis]|uniref:D-alanyl-D-alanine carboxypeptidase family protein n=1 Tax=Ornithinibacillus massiliensis TaxID=1944633 RepID=A0ABS5MGH9_9BACI|nr:D-alanyl-D-alanine carboxypeptidase family protein [Ornithinibacillus massiliensis]MBS3681449.1 D-alanyl-D-alanine carboxypeptidase family protein [Ornithinibacillus massiliensis]
MKNYKSIYLLTLISLLILLSACSDSTPTTGDTSEKTSEEKVQDNPNPTKEDEQNAENPEAKEGFVLPTEDLQKGDQNDNVIGLQEALIKIGYEIPTTGTYDKETVWAITDLQIQSEDLMITGKYDEATRLVIEDYQDQESTVTSGEGLAYSEDKPLDEETVELSNPFEVLALINKQHALPADYVPADLVFPDVPFPFVEDLPKKQIRQVAADALEELFAAAEQEGLDLYAQSGFRSFETQEYLFASYVSNHGEEEANKFSARPGESEHQSGLAMDVTSPQVNFDLVIEFGDTKEGKWLKDHAAEYGFIIRYPKGKEDITGYQYEPWHIRYVGVKTASEIMERDITLEEYLEELQS